MIPRIIHQSWKSAEIPAHLSDFTESWIRLHPTWEYRLWTDSENSELLREHYPWLVETYEGYPLAIQRADMARLLYLHQFGGLYVDLDFECFRPIDPLLEQGNVVMGRENGGLGWYRRGQDYACNALLASPPGHAFWIAVLQRMVVCARQQHRFESRTAFVLATTGPAVLDAVAVSDDSGDVVIHETNAFYPASALERSVNRRRKLAAVHQAYAVHHFSNSWFSLPMHFVMWIGFVFRAPLQWTRFLLGRSGKS